MGKPAMMGGERKGPVRRALQWLRRLVFVGPPPRHHVERERYATVLPGYVRILGPLPFTNKRGHAYQPPSIIVTAVLSLLVAGFLAAISYSRNLGAKTHPIISYSRGIQAFEIGDYEIAKKFLLRAAQGDPLNAKIYYDLGNVYYFTNDDAAAAAAWDRAIMLDPNLQRAIEARKLLPRNARGLAPEVYTEPTQ